MYEFPATIGMFPNLTVDAAGLVPGLVGVALMAVVVFGAVFMVAALFLERSEPRTEIRAMQPTPDVRDAA
jgi:hypothetical protein